MSRQMRLAKMLDRCSWNEKDLERCRKFYKNKRWADYCQNLRYEMAVLMGYSLAKMGLEVKEIKNVKGKE